MRLSKGTSKENQQIHFQNKKTRNHSQNKCTVTDFQKHNRVKISQVEIVEINRKMLGTVLVVIRKREGKRTNHKVHQGQVQTSGPKQTLAISQNIN